MKLDIRKPELNSRLATHPLAGARNTDRHEWLEELQPGRWVKLLDLPSAFSFDEALLLCQCSASEWVAWIPDCGEEVLHTRQFCRQ
jgi:hypothetical protein